MDHQGREASTHRTQNCNGVSEPLLVTELVDGVFIGCTINHMIVDDTSFWYFFNSWLEISRGSNEITLSPVLDRWFVDDPATPYEFLGRY